MAPLASLLKRQRLHRIKPSLPEATPEAKIWRSEPPMLLNGSSESRTGGQQGQPPSEPWASRHAQLGSGSHHKKQFDHHGRQQGEDEHAVSGTTTKDNSLAGSERDVGVDGGTLPWHAKEPSRGVSGPADTRAVAFVNNARVKSKVPTDDGGNGTDNFEKRTGINGIAIGRYPIWMTTSTENQPRNRHTTRDDAGYQVNRSNCRLQRLNAKAIGLSMLPLLALRVSADEVHHRAAKVAATAVSAFVSFGTGMTSLQRNGNEGGQDVPPHLFFDLPAGSHRMLYALVLCRGREDEAVYLGGVRRLVHRMGGDSSRCGPSTGDVSDAFSWLDKVNLFGLLAAVAGIINVRTDGMLRAEVDEVLGSGASANPLLPLTGNNGPGASELPSGVEGSGENRQQSRSEDSAA
ncbi:hypothetical protein B0T18DRAFT_492769 [Schizothecium vesticola]|uniref:Uncharacterized protein n=1 Tax=Schizothecium vesticola TaxID=314040 RepID=A0AA40BRA3_9PEZI|nr:hypothetical protein B0T18DRAFT_492769 [Schizothecium vesticola]